MTASIDTLIALAAKEVGYKEGVNNDNKYAKEIMPKTNNQPWCAIYQVWLDIKNGTGDKILHSASCIEIENWAIKNKMTVPLEQAKKGDLLLMDFSKSGHPQHIGRAVEDYNPKTKTVKSNEGNTGDVNQANGDGVYTKIRQAQFIRTVVRLKY